MPPLRKRLIPANRQTVRRASANFVGMSPSAMRGVACHPAKGAHHDQPT